MKIRRSISVLGVAATALGGVAVASGTANASSGCGITNDGVTACIGVSGGNVTYDAYVGSPSNCYSITLTIRDNDGGADTLNIGCSPGYHGTYSVRGLRGHRYIAIAAVNYEYFAGSPTLTF